MKSGEQDILVLHARSKKKSSSCFTYRWTLECGCEIVFLFVISGQDVSNGWLKTECSGNSLALQESFNWGY